MRSWAHHNHFEIISQSHYKKTILKSNRDMKDSKQNFNIHRALYIFGFYQKQFKSKCQRISEQNNCKQYCVHITLEHEVKQYLLFCHGARYGPYSPTQCVQVVPSPILTGQLLIQFLQHLHVTEDNFIMTCRQQMQQINGIQYIRHTKNKYSRKGIYYIISVCSSLRIQIINNGQLECTDPDFESWQKT